MLFENLMISAAMVILCVTVHALGLTGMMILMRSNRAQGVRHGAFHIRGFAVVMTVFGLMGLHAVEVGAYAVLYQWVAGISDFETALYFSGTTFSTLGYGDVVLPGDRRFLASVEGLLGLILIGWSTAILVTVTTRLLGSNAPEKRVE